MSMAEPSPSLLEAFLAKEMDIYLNHMFQSTRGHPVIKNVY